MELFVLLYTLYDTEAIYYVAMDRLFDFAIVK